MTDENWLRTYQDLTSSEFVFKILRQFSDDFKENECLMNLDEAFLEDFTESRIQMQQSILSEDYNPNSLFIRFDFQASDGTHGLRSPHVDHLRRIVGGVIFFCDAVEDEIEGGDFALWADEKFNDDRRCHFSETA